MVRRLAMMVKRLAMMFSWCFLSGVVFCGCFGYVDEQEVRSNVISAIERAGGVECFVKKCAEVAERMKPCEYLGHDDSAYRELESFCGQRPQLILLNGDRELLTIQMLGGFCHMGLIVKTSAESNLSEPESRDKACGASGRWSRTRVSESVFWYAE